MLCATGKVGKSVCLALHEAGFVVYGTSRSGIVPGYNGVKCNYADKKSLDNALKETGIKLVFGITDTFQSAGGSKAKEIQQGKDIIDTCIDNKVEHFVFCSVGELEHFNEDTHHIKSKLEIEKYLKSVAQLPYSILHPYSFFENFDDKANYNAFKKGHVMGLSTATMRWCGTYDIGRAAAVMFINKNAWLSKSLTVYSWEGSINDFATAVENVTGVKTTAGLALPNFIRWFFLPFLHNMCLYFEAGYPSATGSIEEFKKVIPTALSAEDWVRRLGRYDDGSPIPYIIK